MSSRGDNQRLLPLVRPSPAGCFPAGARLSPSKLVARVSQQVKTVAAVLSSPKRPSASAAAAVSAAQTPPATAQDTQQAQDQDRAAHSARRGLWAGHGTEADARPVENAAAAATAESDAGAGPMAAATAAAAAAASTDEPMDAAAVPGTSSAPAWAAALASAEAAAAAEVTAEMAATIAAFVAAAEAAAAASSAAPMDAAIVPDVAALEAAAATAYAAAGGTVTAAAAAAAAASSTAPAATATVPVVVKVAAATAAAHVAGGDVLRAAYEAASAAASAGDQTARKFRGGLFVILPEEATAAEGTNRLRLKQVQSKDGDVSYVLSLSHLLALPAEEVSAVYDAIIDSIKNSTDYAKRKVEVKEEHGCLFAVAGSYRGGRGGAEAATPPGHPLDRLQAQVPATHRHGHAAGWYPIDGRVNVVVYHVAAVDTARTAGMTNLDLVAGVMVGAVMGLSVHFLGVVASHLCREECQRPIEVSRSDVAFRDRVVERSYCFARGHATLELAAFNYFRCGCPGDAPGTAQKESACLHGPDKCILVPAYVNARSAWEVVEKWLRGKLKKIQQARLKEKLKRQEKAAVKKREKAAQKAAQQAA